MIATVIPLSPAQQQVISLLSNGATVSAAAESAGVHRNTITNWRQTVPAFTRALATAQYDRTLHWRSLLEDHAESAVATLNSLMSDPNAPASVRLKAALAILKECTNLPKQEPALTDVAFKRHIAQLYDPTELYPDTTPEVPEQSCTSTTFQRTGPKVGRNEPCPCKSGRKFKQCCLNT